MPQDQSQSQTPPNPALKLVSLEAFPWLTDQHTRDLLRVRECFDDNEGYDVPKARMQDLAETGLVNHIARGIYQITAFGDFVLDLLDLKAASPSVTPINLEAMCLWIAEDAFGEGASSEGSFNYPVDSDAICKQIVKTAFENFSSNKLEV